MTKKVFKRRLFWRFRYKWATWWVKAVCWPFVEDKMGPNQLEKKTVVKSKPTNQKTNSLRKQLANFRCKNFCWLETKYFQQNLSGLRWKLSGELESDSLQAHSSKLDQPFLFRADFALLSKTSAGRKTICKFRRFVRQIYSCTACGLGGVPRALVLCRIDPCNLFQSVSAKKAVNYRSKLILIKLNKLWKQKKNFASSLKQAQCILANWMPIGMRELH